MTTTNAPTTPANDRDRVAGILLDTEPEALAKCNAYIARHNV